MNKKQLEKTIKKHEAIVEKTSKAKVEALVRARRAEFWIKENSEQYNKLIKKYNEVNDMIKGLIEIKNFPFWMHVYAHVNIFLQDPIKYIFARPKMKSRLVEQYWGFKRIKKEWEDDFKFTESKIEEDYEFVDDATKFIENHKKLLKKCRTILRKAKND
jgi:uncharacterized protein YdcH (DUF465 family)